MSKSFLIKENIPGVDNTRTVGYARLDDDNSIQVPKLIERSPFRAEIQAAIRELNKLTTERGKVKEIETENGYIISLI